MRESSIQGKIKKHLESLGGWVLNVAASESIKVGTPDLVVCMRGQFWAVEVKKPGEKPKPIQVRRLKQIARNGGMVFVWDDIEEAKQEAREVLNGSADRLHGPGSLALVLAKNSRGNVDRFTKEC